MVQASDAVRSAVDGLAVSLAMQGPALMDILDKSLPTAAGLAGLNSLEPCVFKMLSFHKQPILPLFAKPGSLCWTGLSTTVVAMIIIFRSGVGHRYIWVSHLVGQVKRS